VSWISKAILALKRRTVARDLILCVAIVACFVVISMTLLSYYAFADAGTCFFSKNLWELIIPLIAIMMIALFVSVKLIVQTVLHRSLNRIQDGIRIIGEGNYDHRIAESKYYDVDQIVTEINSMAHIISNRTVQLKREIAERKRTETALTESKRKLVTLMQNMPGMAYRCLNDKQYTMKFVSQGVHALTGYTAAQLLDNKELEFGRIIHPDDRDYVYSEVKRCLSENRVYEMEYRINTATGETKWVWETGVGVINAFGDIQALEGFIMDITSRRLAEEELKQLNQELEMRVEDRTADLEVTNRALKESIKLIKDAQKQLVENEKLAALGGMVAGMAHEINNPLGISVTAASYLDNMLKEFRKPGKDNERLLIDSGFAESLDKMDESSRIILSNLRRASELVAGFKRMASDQSHEEKRTFNIKNYIEEILLSLRLETKRAMLSVELQSPDDLIIDSYPGAVSQIITNLVLNSIRHAFDFADGRKIKIDIRKESRYLKITFSDNGNGIPEDIRSKIFDPFFTTKRGEGGSGMGLHIVFNLVSNTLKGKIHCESKENKGTSFIIKIPASELGNTF